MGNRATTVACVQAVLGIWLAAQPPPFFNAKKCFAHLVFNGSAHGNIVPPNATALHGANMARKAADLRVLEQDAYMLDELAAPAKVGSASVVWTTEMSV